jgi:hypothetical protein
LKLLRILRLDLFFEETPVYFHAPIDGRKFVAKVDKYMAKTFECAGDMIEQLPWLTQVGLPVNGHRQYYWRTFHVTHDDAGSAVLTVDAESAIKYP